ncbi:MAG: hypothetical protein JWO80_1689 [Bryobacterales bacterium]|nr:hypothetical protein [Bryobacterales bacterium]
MYNFFLDNRIYRGDLFVGGLQAGVDPSLKSIPPHGAQSTVNRLKGELYVCRQDLT